MDSWSMCSIQRSYTHTYSYPKNKKKKNQVEHGQTLKLLLGRYGQYLVFWTEVIPNNTLIQVLPNFFPDLIFLNIYIIFNKIVLQIKMGLVADCDCADCE